MMNVISSASCHLSRCQRGLPFVEGPWACTLHPDVGGENPTVCFVGPWSTPKTDRGPPTHPGS